MGQKVDKEDRRQIEKTGGNRGRADRSQDSCTNQKAGREGRTWQESCREHSFYHSWGGTGLQSHVAQVPALCTSPCTLTQERVPPVSRWSHHTPTHGSTNSTTHSNFFQSKEKSPAGNQGNYRLCYYCANSATVSSAQLVRIETKGETPGLGSAACSSGLLNKHM